MKSKHELLLANQRKEAMKMMLLTIAPVLG